MKYLLYLLFHFFFCTLLNAHQIHFLHNHTDGSPLQSYHSSVKDLSEILLRTFGLNHELSAEKSPLSSDLLNALGRISNDPLQPIRSYWMLVLSGLPSLDLSGGKFKMRDRTHFQPFLSVDLQSNTSMVDLTELLYYSRSVVEPHDAHASSNKNGEATAIGKNKTDHHRTHLSEILLRNAYNDSFLFYQSQSLPLLFSVIPETLSVIAPLPNYYCSSETLLNALSGVLSSHHLNQVNMTTGFGIPQSSGSDDPLVRRTQESLFAEFRAIPELFEDFRNLSDSQSAHFTQHFYRSSGFNYYAWSTQVFQQLLDATKGAVTKDNVPSHQLAVNLLLSHFLPYTIEDIIELYGDDSLGMILLLDSTPMHTQSNSSRFQYSIQKMSAASSPAKGWIATTRDPNDTLGRQFPFCWPSESDCKKYSRGCYERGNCVSFSRFGGILANASNSPPVSVNTSQSNGTDSNSSLAATASQQEYVCWQCVCDEPNIWTGPSCQYENWSANFFIILFVVLALLAIIMLSVMSLSSLDVASTAGSSNWVFKSAALTSAGHGGHSKSD